MSEAQVKWEDDEQDKEAKEKLELPCGCSKRCGCDDRFED